MVVLPAPLGPSSAETDAGLDAEVDVVEGAGPAEGLADASTSTVYVIHKLYAAYTERCKHRPCERLPPCLRPRRRARRLPPALDLLWGRRDAGQRGPRAELDVDAIVDAAVEIADAEGLEAVSMARVAKAARLHHDVALPARRQQGRAAPADVERQRTRAEDLVTRGRRLAGPAAVVGDHPARDDRGEHLDHPDADGDPAARAQLAGAGSSSDSRRWTTSTCPTTRRSGCSA